VHAVKEFGYPAPSRVLKLGIRIFELGFRICNAVVRGE
jgi:hypothetical protein